MKRITSLTLLFFVTLFLNKLDAQSYVLYGTTTSGGANEIGSIYKYNIATGKDSIVYSASTATGYYFQSGMVLDTLNHLYYGGAAYGGKNSSGVIYSFNPANGQYTDVYDLTSSDGSTPLMNDFSIYNGLIYGMTTAGGTYDDGVLFSFNPSNNQYHVLVNFDDTTGSPADPNSVGLYQYNGIFYGMTAYGGANDRGTLFSFNPSTDQLTVLVTFNRTNGANPYNGVLTRDTKNGLLYGTTTQGGANNYGVVFSYNITTGQENVVYSFNQSNGYQPIADVVYDSTADLLYGITYFGGTNNGGVIYSLNPNNGTYTVLANFSAGTGENSVTDLTFGPCGILYGVTENNGTGGYGTVFSFSPSSRHLTQAYGFSGTPDGASPIGRLALQQVGGTPNSPLPMAPTMSIVSSGNNICSGNSVTLTASGAPIYSWNTGATVDSIIVSPSTTTIYTVTGTISNGCSGSAIDTVIVATPTITIAPSSASILTGSSVQLLASGANTYSWTPSQGLSNTNSDTVTASPTVTTTYTVTGTNSRGCMGTKTVTVSVSVPSGIYINPSAPTICAGSSVKLTASGGKNYTWSTGHAGATLTVSPNTTTTYSVTGLVGNTNSSATVVVTVNPLPVVSIKSSANAICPGGSVTLVAGGANTYSWSPSTGLSSTNSDTVIASPTVATTYTLTGTNVNGCSATATQKITINPVPSIKISGKDTVCYGDSTKLTATGGGAGASYVWNTGATTASIYASPSFLTMIKGKNNQFTVIGTSSVGCVDSATVKIAGNPLPSITATASLQNICKGNTDSLIVAPSSFAPPGYTTSGLAFKWSTGSTNDTTVVVPTTTHTYSVTATTSEGCSSLEAITIGVNPVPTATITGSKQMCMGNLYSVLAKGGVPPYTYSWSAKSGIVSEPTLPSTSITWRNDTGGIAYVTVTDSNHCSATLDSLEVIPCVTMCANDSILHYMLQNDTAFVRKLKGLNQSITNWIDTHPSNSHQSNSVSGAIYTIPVVVHVICDKQDPVYKYTVTHGIPYVPYSQIQSEIAAMNLAFSNQGNPNQTAPNWQTNAQVQFCLAQNAIGVSGWTNSTEPGVMRYFGDSKVKTDSVVLAAHVANISPSGVNQVLGATGQLSNTNVFPTTDYLNIYVVNDIEGENSGLEGFAPTPIELQIGITGYKVDGVVIRADVFGDNTNPAFAQDYILQPDPALPVGTVNNNNVTSFQDGKIQAHETGHWLNLFHTFQSSLTTGDTCAGTTSSDCQTDGDFCCHTVPCTTPKNTYICGSSPLKSTCGGTVQTDNFMYYSDGTCWNAFTDDQVARLQAYLNIQRSNLFSNNNLVATGLLGPKGCLSPQLLSDFTVNPQTGCIDSTLTFSGILPPANTAISYTWSFGDGGTASGATVSHQYVAAGSYIVTLTTQDNSNNTSTTNQTITVNSCSLDPNYIHNAQWYYGQYVSIDFSSGKPIATDSAVADTSIFGYESSYCYSDNTGKLVFYTDGYNLWVPSQKVRGPINKKPVFTVFDQYAKTYPGTTKGGYNYPCDGTRGFTGVPYPGHPNMYVLFMSTDLITGENDTIVRYVIINLTAGVDTISSEHYLYTHGVGMSDAGTIVPHCNGKDYWYLINGYTKPEICAYLVSSLGVDYEPVVSSTNFNFTDGTVSSLKASPDLTHLVSSGQGALNSVAQYDFNPATGTASNEKLFSAGNAYNSFLGVTYSSDSRQIYAIGAKSYSYDIVQFDTNGNYKVDTTLPHTTGFYSWSQLGPDDNIYFCQAYAAVNYLSAIDLPNTPISSGGGKFVLHAVNYLHQFDTVNGLFGSVPNLMDGIQPAASSPTFTLQYLSCNKVTFVLNPCWGGYIATWNFGDGTPTANGYSVPHSYTAAGSYTVTCNLTIPGSSSNIPVIQTINITAPAIAISGPKNICQFVSTPPTYSVPPDTAAKYTWKVTGGTIVLNNNSSVQVSWGTGPIGILTITDSIGGCVAVGIDTVHILPLPTITIAANNSGSVCSGANITLMASGASSYLWNNGTTTNTSNPLMVTITTAGVYTFTVNGVGANGCTASASYTDTVSSSIAPTVTITPSSTTSFCIGGSVILTASGASTYSWSPSTGLNKSTGAKVTATPADTTVYTVTATALNGCTNQQTITIDVNPSCCYAVGATVINGGTLAGNNIYNTTSPVTVNGPIIIPTGSALTFNNCPDIMMGKNSKITVSSGAALYITNSRLFGCGDMWPGILVQPGGSVIVTASSKNSAIIEDAITGIYGEFNATSSADISLAGGVLMNDNYNDIMIAGVANSTIYTQSSVYPLTLDKTLFTCQPDGVYSLGKLKSPYAGQLTNAGVTLYHIQGAGITIGNISSAALANTFSNMAYGIYSTQSTFDAVNDTFENMYTNVSTICKKCPPAKITGAAIYGISSKATVGGTNTSTVKQSNTFKDVAYGVYLQLGLINEVRNNNFATTKASYPAKTDAGIAAIFVKLDDYNRLDLNSNTISSYATGIQLERSGGAVPKDTASNMNIDSNTISCIGSKTSLQVNNGIFVEDIGPFTQQSYSMNIGHNTISYASTGISLLNLGSYPGTSNTVSVSYNNIHILPPVSATATLANTGIQVSGCSSHMTIGPENEIYATGTTLILNNTHIKGIYTTSSYFNTLECNNVYDCGQDVVFQGSCSPSYIRANSFGEAYDGLVENNSGFIGTQSGGVSDGNTWASASSFGRGQTSNFNSAPANSILYENPLPTLNYGNPTNDKYTTAPPSTATLKLGTAGINPCPIVPIHFALMQASMDSSVSDTSAYPVYTQQVMYTGQSQTFAQIDDDSTVMAGDSVLQNFYTANKNKVMGVMRKVDNMIVKGNFSTALALNSSLIPTNLIEQNEQEVNNIFLTTLGNNNDSLTSGQIDTLFNIASQCALTGGQGVYAARALYDWVMNTNYTFTDSCRTREDDANRVTTIDNNVNAKVYPNPANSLLNIEVVLSTNQTDNICIYNSIGELVHCEALKNNLTTLNIKNLSDGIYYYRIEDMSGNLIASDKVIIIH